MNRFSYRVYYQYNGPTKSDPLRSRRTDEEIAYSLKRVGEELPYHISDKKAVVTNLAPPPDSQSTHSVHIVVSTTLDEPTTDEAVKTCLGSLDLFGEKISSTQV